MPDSKSVFGDGVTTPNQNEENLPSLVNTELPAVRDKDPGVAYLDSYPAAIRNKLTKRQRDQLTAYGRKSQFGFSATAAPMICKDEQCPYHAKCPLVKLGIPRPFGEDCPVEQAQIESWMYAFTTAADIDANDPVNAYDMMIVDQIVFQMVVESRAAWQMALDPRIEKQVMNGYSPSGQPMYSTETSHAAVFYEKLMKTKLKLMKELLQTRKAKVDAEKKGWADPSEQARNLMIKGATIKKEKKSPDGTIEITTIETVPTAPPVPGERVQDAEFEVKPNEPTG